MGSTPAPLTFRVATAADVPSLQPFIQSAYRGEASRAGWTTEADLVSGTRIDEAGILAKINEPNGVILLAHDADGRLTGCCEVLRRDDSLGYFGLFAVDPQRQGGGFGKLVLAEAERYARDVMKIARLEMTVIWTRDELISWYVRRGYKKLDERREFPHEEIAKFDGKAIRDDLWFTILVKDL